MTRRLTVGITTRNRPASLIRCLLSLGRVVHLDPEVLVFDDRSEVPVEDQLSDVVLPVGYRVLRSRSTGGYISGRNRIVFEARGRAVLLLDDDAALIEGRCIDQALEVLERDPHVAAIAFAQADEEGASWPERMQPASCTSSSSVPAFIGFAHLVRRATFVAVGGYRESFVFYGEEKDFCLRLLDAGYGTVYLPHGRIVHHPDATGRDAARHLRYVTRNDSLHALYNEPLDRLMWLLPARMYLYFRMRRAWRVSDPWGWAWVVREVAAGAFGAWQERRPVSRGTIARWQALRKNPEPYALPSVMQADTLAIHA
jgi:GT2 family glycosyltransferase